MKRFLLVVGMVLLCQYTTMARNLYSRVASGNWNTSGTWSTVSHAGGSCGCVPTNGDFIYIESGDVISIGANYDYDPGTAIVLYINGELKFTTGKIDLPTGSKIFLYNGSTLNTTGGGGSSDRIRINGNTIWSAASGDLTGPMNADDGGFDSGLPVEMIFFTSKVETNHVSLLWGTAQEINNSHFEVQRSFDGINFSVIKMVTGQGTTQNNSEYQVSDELFPGKTVYYRLKQVDINSEFSLSDIISVYTGNDLSGIKIFPNPVVTGESFNLELHDPNLTEETLVVLTDAMGNELFSNIVVQIDHGVNTVINPPYGLNPGIYYIKATSNNQIFNEKLIVK